MVYRFFNAWVALPALLVLLLSWLGLECSQAQADTVPPTLLSTQPAPDAVLRRFRELQVSFSEPVTGVEAKDLLLNGQPAESVAGQGAGPYLFSFASPSPGKLQLAWAASHEIKDLANPAQAFAGGSWSYTLDVNALVDSIVISEILADSVSGTFLDEDGEAQDWIELNNRGNRDINLAGWALTDDERGLDTWVFPSKVIPPGGFLVVFASGKDRRAPTGSGKFHTHFKLAASGEYLALLSPEFPRDVVRVFAPTFSEQRSGLSFGFNANNALVHFQVPTPGAANQGGVTFTGVVAEPNANIKSGFFKETFSVILSTPTPGSTIRYTLNGTIPTQTSGTVYSQPIPIAPNSSRGGVTLRAAAFKSGMLSSEVATYSYLFPHAVLKQGAVPQGFPATWVTQSGTTINADYQMDAKVVDAPAYAPTISSALLTLPSVSIVMNVNDLFSRTSGIYANPRLFGVAWERAASVEILYPDRVSEKIDCGVRIQGGSSREEGKTRKHSFRLLFKGDYGEGKLKTRLFPDSMVHEVDTLVLDAGLNYTFTHPDHSQRVRTQLVRDLFLNDLHKAAGNPAVEGRFVHVYLNGLYWGISWAHERPDDSFASSRFGGEKIQYDALKNTDNNTLEVVAGDRVAYDAMMALVNAGLAANAQYESLQQYLDIPVFIDYMILNIWAGNVDWPFKNWYIVRKREPGGTFKFIPWDSEKSMDSEAENRSTVNDANSPGTIYDNLRLHNAEFKLKFADHLQRHFLNGGPYFVDPAAPRWNPEAPEKNRPATLYMRRIEEIRQAMMTESARWGDSQREGQPYTRDGEWKTELDRMMDIYFVVRTSNVFEQFKLAGLYPNIVPPSFNRHGGRVPKGFSLQINLSNKKLNGVEVPIKDRLMITTNGSDPRLYGGAISPAAVEWTPGSTLVLNQSCLVKARALTLDNAWSALNEAHFEVGDLRSPLRFSEIMYHPVGDEPYEFVEIWNSGSVPLRLKGVRCRGIDFQFLENDILAGGQRIVLASSANPVEFSRRYPAVSVHGYFSGELANSGETLQLEDEAGHVLTSVTYRDDEGWSRLADGEGFSLELRDPQLDVNDPANWQASSAQRGSPGLAPVIQSRASSPVLLHEIMAANVSAVLHEGGYSDWVELKNSSASPVPLSGWSLTDDSDTRKFIFATGTILPANGFLIVWCDANFNRSGIHTGFGLKQSGQSLFLFNDAGGLVDVLTWGMQLPDLSLGRINDGWKLNQPTPGAANVEKLTAPVSELSINEWMAAPSSGNDWFEVHHRANLPLALGGLFLGNGSSIHRWPSHSFLAPGQFLQILADDSDEGGHVPFKLPAEGGVIHLYDALGAEIQTVRFGAQASGVSQGRFPDSSATIRTFPGTASPGVANYVAPISGLLIHEVLARNDSALLSPESRYADFIELHNPTATAIDLGGMSVEVTGSDVHRWKIPAGVALPSKGFLVIWADNFSMPSLQKSEVLQLGSALPGQGGKIALLNSAGQIIDALPYGFQIRNQSIGRVGASAKWNLLETPSPGMANGPAVSLSSQPAIRINEWLASSKQDEEFLEFYNAGTLPLDLSGAMVTDDPSLQVATALPFPPLSLVPAKGWVRMQADGQPELGPDHLPFRLDAQSGEMIRLMLPNRTILTEISFGPQGADVSEGRLPDGANLVVRFPDSSSPGTANYLPQTNVVFHELLALGRAPMENAIELYNAGNGTVDISGWFLGAQDTDLKRFKLPAGSILPARGYFVLYQQQWGSQILLDGIRGGTLYLSNADAQGNLTGFRTHQAYGPLEANAVQGRVPGLIPSWSPLMAPTFGVSQPTTIPDFRKGTGQANSGPVVGPVAINEIQYIVTKKTGEDQPQYDFVELANPGSEAVTLSRPESPRHTWKLEGGIEYRFEPGVSIPAKGFLIVVGFDPLDATRLNAFRARYDLPPATLVVGPWKGNLSNQGETIRLIRPLEPRPAGTPEAGFIAETMVESISFSDQTPWPVSIPGHSLQKQGTRLFGNNPAHWKLMAATPGRPNGGNQDADQDGMPDAWESEFGLNPQDGSDALEDEDQDGAANVQEYLAGTQPNNSDDVLKITKIQVSGGQLEITFPGIEGKNYAVQSKVNLNSAWVLWEQVTPTTTGPVKQSKTWNGQQQFFRLVVEP